MKSAIPKIIAYILLGGLLHFLLANYVLTKEVSASNIPTKVEPIIECDTGQANMVCLNKALDNTFTFRLWLKYIPNIIQIDTNNNVLSYTSDTISEADMTLLRPVLTDFWNSTSTFEYPNLPYHGLKNHAYFISKEDIMGAFDVVKQSTIADTANGIRVYLASEGLRANNFKDVETHLYVVPTYAGDTIKSGEYVGLVNSVDFIPGPEGEQYVFDLTTPCPAYCDSSSVLNFPEGI